MSSGEPLSQLLRSWKHQPEADPCFATDVWQRIQRSEQSETQGSTEVGFWRQMPLGWAAACVIVAGSLAAGTAAYAYTELTQEDRQLAAYVKSIDPIHRTGSHSHASPAR